ncbi:helix-turn-helix transcriptional regulator [Geodermatophilus sp. SYSU D00703]
MSGREPDLAALRWELAAIVSTLHETTQAALELLGRIVPFDAAWLAVRDPERRRHTPLATAGPADALRRCFLTPEADDEVEQFGLNRTRTPMLVGEIPVPLPELRAWAEHLLPAGSRGGLAAGLFTLTGRHVGFLSLLSDDPHHLDRIDRRIVEAVRSVIAGELDRTREIAETAQLVEGAVAGVVLTRGGDALRLPGLPEDRLLTRDSRVLTTAARELAEGGSRTGFLAPADGDDPERLVRVTALDCAIPQLDHLSTAVFLSPPGDLRGLGTFHLRVLGLVVDGTTSIPAIAGALGVDTTRVADALHAALAALSAPNLTAAAVRALRAGLRIPPQLAGGGPTAT